MCLSHLLTTYIYYITISSFAIVVAVQTSTEKKWSHCQYNSETVLTCAHQLLVEDATISDCAIKFYTKNTKVCEDLKITTNPYNKDMGKVRLHMYYDAFYPPGRNFPNVTFSNIKWNYLLMQYKTRETSTTNLCREFNLTSPVSTSTELFYDCKWFDSIDYGGFEFDFRYEAHDDVNNIWEGRHFVFKLPKSRDPEKTNLKDWELFMYMDISELPSMTLRWDAAPERFHVNGYKVHVYHKTDDSNDTIVHGTVLSNSELAYQFDIGSISGTVFVTLELMHKNCTQGACYVSVFPDLTIGQGSRTPLLIGIVGSVVLLPVFLYAFYVWRRYGLLSSGSLPVVLIIYRQSLATHTKAIVALAQYLRDFCQVQALLDELDIPHTETKNPFTWYQEAFMQADTVMVLSSPPFSNSKDGIYHNVDTVGLRLFAEKFSNPHCTHKFFSVLLPYCSEGDIPLEASNLHQFMLMHDLNEMLWYIHHGTKYSWLSKVEYCCFQSHMPGGASDFKQCGQLITEAFAKAKVDVENQYDENLSPDIMKKSRSNIALLFKDETSIPLSYEVAPFKDPLLIKYECDLHNPSEEFPGNIADLNLLGTEATSLTQDDEGKMVHFLDFNVNDLPLSGKL